MTQIDKKFRFVFKLHRSDLHTKNSNRIQHILFYRALQKFEYALTFTVSFYNVQNHHEISICFKNTHICFAY